MQLHICLIIVVTYTYAIRIHICLIKVMLFLISSVTLTVCSIVLPVCVFECGHHPIYACNVIIACTSSIFAFVCGDNNLEGNIVIVKYTGDVKNS